MATLAVNVRFRIHSRQAAAELLSEAFKGCTPFLQQFVERFCGALAVAQRIKFLDARQDFLVSRVSEELSLFAIKLDESDRGQIGTDARRIDGQLWLVRAIPD